MWKWAICGSTIAAAMMITGNTLFAFVDSQDPFERGPVAGELQAGPILSLMESRRFNFVFLFHAQRTRKNAHDTAREIAERHPGCHVMLHPLPDSNRKDVSSLVEELSRQVNQAMGTSKNSKNHVSMSSGTPEMRAALFLLVAAGALPATLLEVRPPGERLFGRPAVKEVQVRAPDAARLSDIVTRREYRGNLDAGSQAEFPEEEPTPVPSDRFPELEDALKELQICIGSGVMHSVAENIAVAAPTDISVLLLGETGTGKERFARLVHRLSQRRGKRFETVNCGAMPQELMDSELFGHVKGAFTGAVGSRIGSFELADKGTLFLDEVAELKPEQQTKLLRALQEGEIRRLGSSETRKVDVRIVAATNRNLEKRITEGQFREDLYYRLQRFEVTLPPLRERGDEVLQLAERFLDRYNRKYRRRRTLAHGAWSCLAQHSWPGNVRELENLFERVVLVATSDVIEAEDLMVYMKVPGKEYLDMLPVPRPGFDLRDFLGEVRRHQIRKALSMCDGNQARAAELLGISRQALSDFFSKADDSAA